MKCPRCSHEWTPSRKQAASAMGKAKTDAKGEAARANGAKGGRPEVDCLCACGHLRSQHWNRRGMCEAMNVHICECRRFRKSEDGKTAAEKVQHLYSPTPEPKGRLRGPRAGKGKGQPNKLP